MDLNTNIVTMNNITYEISVEKDTLCHKFMRKMCCCCNYSRIYRHGDPTYNNIVNFVYICTKYMKPESTKSLIQGLEYIYDSKITLLNIHSLYTESMAIILNITDNDYKDDYIQLYGTKSMLDKIEVHKWKK